nr:MAG: hypothetical protein BEN19_05015 [Epulopiscium sp. Nuni2H_MBin003]
MSNVHIYRPDMLVRLSNGDIGVVLSEGTINPFKPRVKLVKTRHFQLGHILDLHNEPKLDIIRLVDYVD